MDDSVDIISIEMGQLARCHVKLEGDSVEGVLFLHRVLQGARGLELSARHRWKGERGGERVEEAKRVGGDRGEEGERMKRIGV